METTAVLQSFFHCVNGWEDSEATGGLCEHEMKSMN